MALAGKSLELQMQYTSAQIDEFWATKDGEKRRYGAARTIGVSNSVEPFWQRVRKRFDRSDKSFRNSNPSSVKINRNALTWDDFNNLEKVVAESIATTGIRKNRFYESPSSVQRIGRSTQDFLVNFQMYCQAFSGIAHLMDGLSYGSSTAALDVLSVFTMVAVNKSDIEDKLEAMIRTLSTEYARIGRLKTIYTSEKIQECVIAVYHLSISFLKEATIYFSYSSRRRLWYVLHRPPSIDLDVRLSEIKSSIAEMVEERDTLDRERLNRLETKMDSYIDDASSEKAAARLEKIASILRLPRANVLNEFQSYATLVEDVFSGVRRLPPLDSRALFRTPKFSSWETQRLSFLLVQGQTVAPYNTALSWISLASIATIRHLQDSEALIAWYLCKPNDHYEDEAPNGNDTKLAAPLAIITLGYRLLDTTAAGRRSIAACSVSDFGILQDGAQVIQDLFAAYNRPEKQPRLMQCTQAAVDFLRTCISIISKHRVPEESKGADLPIYFIVDRFDKLPLPDTALLKPLIDLKSHVEAGVSVKTLAVGERKLRHQKGGDAVADFIDDHEGKIGFDVLEIDQKS